MQTIIDHLPLGIFWKDLQGLYLGANRYSLLRNSDLKLEFLIGRNDYSMPWGVKAEKIQEIDNLIVQSKRAHETREMFEFDFYKEPIGDMYCLKLPLFKQDVVYGVLGMAINISNKRYREAPSEIYYNQKIYVEMFEQLKYEYKQTLVAIIGSINLTYFWLEKNNKKEVQSYLERTQKTIIMLTKILSRYQQIQQHQYQEGFYLFDLVQDEISLAKSLIYPHQQLEIFYSIDSMLPKKIKKDSHRFASILRHLLSNAIKFTPAGNIKVELLRGQKIGNQQQILLLQVQDSGLGLSTEIQDKIKMSFLSPESNPLKMYRGLHTIINNVISLGGTLTCSSSYSQGSIFRVELPLDT